MVNPPFGPQPDALLEAVRIVKSEIEERPMNGDLSRYRLRRVLIKLAHRYPERLPVLLDESNRWPR